MKYMEYGEYKETLKVMLDRVRNGEWTLPKFKNDFYKFYLEEVPGEVLSDEEWLFYSTVIESLDYIFATPTLIGQ
jgi:hypothetical protein